MAVESCEKLRHTPAPHPTLREPHRWVSSTILLLVQRVI